jgi:hypothetical protein
LLAVKKMDSDAAALLSGAGLVSKGRLTKLFVAMDWVFISYNNAINERKKKYFYSKFKPDPPVWGGRPTG